MSKRGNRLLLSRPAILLTATLSLLLTATAVLPCSPTAPPLSSARLVADVESVAPGEPFYAGFWIELAPGWHTYWRNPGDSGFAPSVLLHLPDGGKAGDILWPAPAVFTVPPLVNYGYADAVLLPIRIELPPNAATSGLFRIEADLAWLICREICIPFEAKLVLSLPVQAGRAEPAPAWTNRFARAIQSVPQHDPSWSFSAEAQAGRLAIRLTLPANVPETDLAHAILLAADPGFVTPTATTVWRKDNTDNTWIAELTLVNASTPPSRFAGVLLIHPEIPQSLIASQPVRTDAVEKPRGSPANHRVLAFEVPVMVHPKSHTP